MEIKKLILILSLISVGSLSAKEYTVRSASIHYIDQRFDPEFCDLVQESIDSNWQPEKYLRHGLPRDTRYYKRENEKIVSTKASFDILPDGRISKLKVIKSSNSVYYDSSCIRAIKDAAPFSSPAKLTKMQFDCNIAIQDQDFSELIYNGV